MNEKQSSTLHRFNFRKIGMNINMLAFVTALLFVIYTSGCTTAARNSNQFQEMIALPFIDEDQTSEWKIGYSTGNQLQRVTEFVRQGETVENWTEMIVSQTFNKAVGLVDVSDQIDAYREDITSRCPGSTVNVIQLTADDALYEAQITNCAQGADENMIARILDGTGNRFIIQYTVRGTVTMTSERQAEWIKKLMSAWIISVP